MIEIAMEILVLVLLVAAVTVTIIFLAVGAMLGVVSLRILGRVNTFLKHIGKVQRKVGRQLS